MGTTVTELETLAADNLDVFAPVLYSPAVLVASNKILLRFSEALDLTLAEDIGNYSLQNFSGTYSITNAVRQSDWSKVELTISETFSPGDEGQVAVIDIADLHGNIISGEAIAYLTIPAGITPHTVFTDGVNDFLNGSELIETQTHNLWITWDDDNLYVGFYDMDLNADGDLFINIDTDQTSGNGATSGSWGRVTFADPFLPEYQVAIEGGGGSMQVNNWIGSSWNYPGNGTIGSSYEGWSGNGLTEIAISWDDLGNPAGFAISVHVSAEDSQMVSEIFPSINSIGSHPEITHFYAFYQPYIIGPMPLSGMEPNTVSVVPNTAPQITSYLPTELSLSMIYDTQQDFSVTAIDAENDDITYSFILDGTLVSSTTDFLYEPGIADVGNHILHAIVSDQIALNDLDTIPCRSPDYEPDGDVDLSDFVLFAQDYHSHGLRSDFNFDGDCSLVDFAMFAQHYGHRALSVDIT